MGAHNLLVLLVVTSWLLGCFDHGDYLWVLFFACRRRQHFTKTRAMDNFLYNSSQESMKRKMRTVSNFAMRLVVRASTACATRRPTIPNTFAPHWFTVHHASLESWWIGRCRMKRRRSTRRRCSIIDSRPTRRGNRNVDSPAVDVPAEADVAGEQGSNPCLQTSAKYAALT